MILPLFLPLLILAGLGRSAPTVKSVRIPGVDPVKVLCSLLSSMMMNKLCPRGDEDRLSRDTVFGVAQGSEDPSGAQRFIVKYANSQRWEPSTLVSSWTLPYGFVA